MNSWPIGPLWASACTLLEVAAPWQLIDLDAPLWAHWYSGELHVPQGEPKDHMHGGFGDIHARMLVITLCKGKVVDRQIKASSLL